MEESNLIESKKQNYPVTNTDLVVIGGSAGSFEILFKIIPILPKNFPCPVVVIIHRKKNDEFAVEELLQNQSKLIVKEADDKENLKSGFVYFAPADYHLLIERDKTFSFDAGEKVRFSRPSIDVTFESAAEVYRERLTGIILSGANNDGAAGLMEIKKQNGITIAENPETAAFTTMPLAAIQKSKVDFILDANEIAQYLIKLSGI
jgi:two-component system chemotaxis response regulator CheB